jgi:hypothetical protein
VKKLNWKTSLLGLLILALQLGKPFVAEQWRGAIDQACLAAAGVIGLAARDHDNDGQAAGDAGEEAK